MGRLEELTIEAQQKPHEPGVWSRLARVLDEAGHRGAAREAADRARGLAREPAAWIEVGQVYEALGDKRSAVLAFREATRLHRRAVPGNGVAGVDAYLHLGANLLGLGETEAAVLSLRVAVRLAPTEARTHCRLAEALEQAGLYHEALLHAERAVDLDFEAPEGHRALAKIHARLGRGEDAVEALRTLTVIAPDDLSAVIELATRLFAMGSREEARGLLTRVGERAERTPENLLRLGQALLSTGDLAGAVKVLREAIRMQPSLADAQLSLGEALEAANALNDAVVAYQAAVSLAPKDATARHRLGLTLLAVGRQQDAVRTLVQASALNPESTAIREALARALSGSTPRPVSAPVHSAAIESAEGSFTGDLGVFALAEVLEFLLVQRATGFLRVSAEEGAGVVELHRGQIVSASTTTTRSLRERLEREGADLSAILPGRSGAFSEAQLLGLVLERGLVSRDVVLDHLQRCVHESLDRMVAWKRGQVRFHAMSEPTGGRPELAIDTRWALLDIARRADESGR